MKTGKGGGGQNNADVFSGRCVAVCNAQVPKMLNHSWRTISYSFPPFLPLQPIALRMCQQRRRTHSAASPSWSRSTGVLLPTSPPRHRIASSEGRRRSGSATESRPRATVSLGHLQPPSHTTATSRIVMPRQQPPKR